MKVAEGHIHSRRGKSRPPALNDSPVQRHLTEYGVESNYGLPKCKLQAGFSLGILVAGERCNQENILKEAPRLNKK